MDHGMRGWMFRKAKQEYWRVAAVMEFDELIQEGHLCFLKLKRVYPDATPPQQMNLFKRIFANRIHDITRDMLKHEAEVSEATLGVDLSMVDANFFTHPDISSALALIPDHLRTTLFALANDPRAEVSFLWLNGGWETPDQKLCRVAGVEPTDTPLMDQLRAYLTEAFSGHRMVKV